jgi:hypothetical protein
MEWVSTNRQKLIDEFKVGGAIMVVGVKSKPVVSCGWRKANLKEV